MKRKVDVLDLRMSAVLTLLADMGTPLWFACLQSTGKATSIGVLLELLHSAAVS